MAAGHSAWDTEGAEVGGDRGVVPDLPRREPK